MSAGGAAPAPRDSGELSQFVKISWGVGGLGATSMLSGLPLQSVLLPALLLNPVDLVRVLVVFAVGSGALFGPTSAALMGWLGTGGGLAVGIAALLVEIAVPLVFAVWRFERRDW